jgi:hypothetical protein
MGEAPHQRTRGRAAVRPPYGHPRRGLLRARRAAADERAGRPAPQPFADPISVSRRQIGAFHELFEEGNNREVQPLKT